MYAWGGASTAGWPSLPPPPNAPPRPTDGPTTPTNHNHNHTKSHKYIQGEKTLCVVDGAFADARCSLKTGQTLAQAKAAVAAESKLEVLK